MNKLLVLCKDFDAPGGVANFVHSILTNLPGGPGGIEARQLSIGRPTGQETLLARLISPFRDNFALARALREYQPDCVHLNPSFNWPSLLRDGVFMLVLTMLGYSNVLVFFHGWRDQDVEKLGGSRVGRWLFRSVFGRAKVTCVLASRFKTALMALGLEPESIHVITTMFDAANFKGLTRTRKEKGKEEEQTLVFLGRIVGQKGIFETLRAFANLKKSDFPNLRLMVAGDGPELDDLRHEAESLNVADVEFLGYVTGAAKAQLLLDGDYFVFPTYYPEGCPVSLLEAMAAGLPVLTGTAGGIPDILQHGVHGILLDDIQIATVEQAIRHMLENPQECDDMRRTNLEKAWREFIPEAVVGKIMALYETVATRGVAM